MTKAQLVKTALKAKKKDAGNVSSSEETTEDNGKSLPLAGQNSAQKVSAPKKGAKGKGKVPPTPGKTTKYGNSINTKPKPFWQKAKMRGGA